MGRLPDFGEDGAPAATVVEPGGTDDTFQHTAGATRQESSSEEGTSRVEPSADTREGPPVTPAAPIAPAAPASPPSSDDPPASVPPGQTSLLDGEQGDAVADGAPGLQQLADWETKILERAAEDNEERLRSQQGGQDKIIAGMRATAVESDERYQKIQEELREVSLKGLAPEEQERLRSEWNSADDLKKLDAYRTELDTYHLELDDFRLVQAYSQYGVTEEMLSQLPDGEERAIFCEQVRGDYLEDKIKELQTNGSPPVAAALATTSQPAPAPAGASAPSDTSGAGVSTTPDKPDEGKGLDSMASNIGRGDSWETKDFSVRR